MNPIPSSSDADEDLVGRVVDAYMDALDQGLEPSIEECADEHPEIAEILKDVLPAIRALRLSGRAEGPPATNQHLGQTLGDFRLRREIGRGGMGVVFEAEQLSAKRRVAVKVLAMPLGRDDRSGERFRREATATAQLHHTNIVPIHAVGVDEGTPYFAMQFIDGRSLADWLAWIRSSPDANVAAMPAVIEAWALSRTSSSSTRWAHAVARIGQQVALAVGYAHSRGIVHRDIKPGNLLVDEASTVWVTDFGLAKTQGGDDLTRTGEMVGTLRYMAPERLEGDSGPAGDIYAIGLVLHELVTLEPAVPDGEPGQQISRIMQSPVPSPRSAIPSLPSDLNTIIRKCTERDPRARYPTAADLAEDLRRFLAGETILARRASSFEQFARWCRRNPGTAMLSTAVASLVVLLALGSLAAAIWLGHERNVARIAEARAEASEHKATQRLFDAYLSQAKASRLGNRSGRQVQSLDSLRRAAELVDPLGLGTEAKRNLRSEIMECLALADLVVKDHWKSSPEPLEGRRHFSSALDRYTEISEDRRLFLRRAGDGVILEQLPNIIPGPSHAIISPCDRWFAVHGKENNRFQTVLWNRSQQSKQAAIDLAQPLAFSPSGNLLIVANFGKMLHVVDTETGMKRDLVLPDRATSACVSPDGGKLVVTFEQGEQAIVYDSASLEEWARNDEAGGIHAAAWHPSGKTLVLGNGSTLNVWEPSGGRTTKQSTGHQTVIRKIAYAPDGRYLVTSSYDNTVRLHDAVDAMELASAELAAGTETLRFGPDGRTLAHARDGTEICLLELVRPKTLVRCGQHQFLTSIEEPSIGFTSDGRHLVTGAMTDGFRLWNIDTGESLGFRFQPGMKSIIPSGPGTAIRFLHGRSAEAFQLQPQDDRIVWEQTSARKVDGPYVGLARGSQDGRRIVAINYPMQAGFDVWLLESAGDHMERIKLGTHPRVRRLAISADGRFAVTCPWSGPKAWVWNLDTREVVEQIGDADSMGRFFASFNQDGTLLALGTPRYVDLFDTQSWKSIWRIPRSQAGTLPGPSAFSPDGRWLAVTDDLSSIKIYDIQERTELLGWRGRSDRQISEMIWSPDGRSIATVLGRKIEIWRIDRLQEELRPLDLDWSLDH